MRDDVVTIERGRDRVRLRFRSAAAAAAPHRGMNTHVISGLLLSAFLTTGLAAQELKLTTGSRPGYLTASIDATASTRRPSR